MGEPNDKISFKCKPELYDEIAHPVPAVRELPDWYKSLPADSEYGRTVKACMPFFDALSAGWVIPAPFDFYVEVEEDGAWDMECLERGYKLIDSHRFDQIGGYENPQVPCPLFKFNNPWRIDTPEGVSVLVTSPFNRHDPRFQTFSGIVETDNYPNRVNFPSIWKQAPYRGVVEAGTPLAQVVPFERDALVADGAVRTLTESEEAEMREVGERLGPPGGTYHDEFWKPKPQPRLINEENHD